MTYTPGPWRVAGGDTVLACHDAMMVCELRGWGYLSGAKGLSDDEATRVQEANAKLIAAAPDLLEFCEELWADMLQHGSDLPTRLENMLRAAMAKATKAVGVE